MTQRIFDTDNSEDMALLWSILPDSCRKITVGNMWDCIWEDDERFSFRSLFKINWHDKTEIKRPIQEATKEDIKKLCLFWDENYSGKGVIGLLSSIDGESVCNRYYMEGGTWWTHCRRLTNQEIEELI